METNDRAVPSVIYIEEGLYHLHKKQDWDAYTSVYMPSRQATETIKECELDSGWFNVLYFDQWRMGAQKVLKEIYEEHIDGNSNGNG